MAHAVDTAEPLQTDAPLTSDIAGPTRANVFRQIGSKSSVVKGIKRVALYVKEEDKVAD